MGRGALIAIFVVLLTITIPCATFVGIGWLVVAANSKTANGQSAREDVVINHPFWKTPPTPAELKKIAALMTKPGVRTVAVDDQGRTAVASFSASATLSADFSQRVVWVRCNPHWDLPRIHGELKAQIDAFVNAEAGKKLAPGDDE